MQRRLAKYERVTGRWFELEDCASPWASSECTQCPSCPLALVASVSSSSRRGPNAELPGTQRGARRAATMMSH